MRSNRSIRNRGKRKKPEVMDIDITSLLDILVILLVFLLKSYNSSGQVINVPKGVDLPISESQSISSSGTIVQVSPSSIWVDDKEVMIHRGTSISSYSDRGNRIIPLLTELRKKKAEIEKISNQAPKAKEFTGRINLLVDKTIKYSFLQRIMHTSASAGFSQFKFVVLGTDN
jgi:biopolymer transport protein ExbD